MEISNGRVPLGAALGFALGIGAGWFLSSLRVAGTGGQTAATAALDGVQWVEAREQSERGEPIALAPEPASDERLPARPSGASAAIEVPESRIAELVATADAPDVERPAGDGAISGRVADPEGRGVPGVALRAVKSASAGRTVAPSSIGQGPPTLSDLDGAVREAVDRYAETRSNTFEARTDAAGDYRFEGLPDGRWRVDAYKLDHVIEAEGERRRDVPTGGQLDFIAQRVVTVPVQVTFADGGAPDSAVVTCAREVSGASRSVDYAWSPAEASLRIAPGEYELQALGLIFETRSAGSTRGSELRSEAQTVELVAGVVPPTLTFVLEGRAGIRGRVTFARDEVIDERADVRLLALGLSREADLDLLGQAEQRVSVRSDDDYAFLDLEPGRYAVGATRGNDGPVCVHEVVEVGASIMRCDLALPPLDLSQYLAIRAFGADGGLLDGLSFSFMHFYERGSSSGSGYGAMRTRDGRYLLTIPQEARADYFAGTAGHTFELGIEHGDYGSKTVALAAGQTELDVSFAVPARLEAVIAGYATNECAGRLWIVLARAAKEEDRSYSYGGSSDGRPDPDGVQIFDAVDPGAYELRLMLSEKKGAAFGGHKVIHAQAIQLASGPNAVRVPIPPLYPVAVRCASGVPPNGVQLTPREKDGSAASMVGAGWSAFDAEGRARFEGVPPGPYTLTVWRGGSGDNIVREIEVPCGEIDLGPE